MVLPAAAQTASMLHPPEARPANPPTLPLSAPTGSGEEGGGKRRGSRGTEARLWKPETAAAPLGRPLVAQVLATASP